MSDYLLLYSLLLTPPLMGVLAIFLMKDNGISLNDIKFIALVTDVTNLFISVLVFILFFVGVIS